MAKAVLEVVAKKGVGGFADLQALGQILVGLASKVKDAVVEADKFNQVLRNVTIDIGPADKATKGLIDTFELMRSANKFTAAGMEMTADQFKIVSVAATDFAQKTGIDATESMKRLTESISKGSSRALKELGIDLEESEDQVLAQAEAMDKLTEKYGDATVEIETLSEAMYSVKNNFETTTSLMSSQLDMLVGGDGLVDAIAQMSDGWAKFNTAMMDSPNLMRDTIFMMFDLLSSSKDLTIWMSKVPALLKAAFSGGDVQGVINDMVRSTQAGQKYIQARRDDIYSQGVNKIVQENEASKLAAAGRSGGRGGGKKKKKNGKRDAAPEGLMLEESVDDKLDSMRMAQENLAAIEEARIERMEEQAKLEEQELNRAERWLEAQDKKYDKLQRANDQFYEFRLSTEEGQRNITHGFNVMNNATMQAFEAIIVGGVEGKAAFKLFSAAILQEIARMAGVQVSRNIAEAVSAFARQQYSTGGKHMAAAAAWGVVSMGAGIAGAAVKQSANQDMKAVRKSTDRGSATSPADSGRMGSPSSTGKDSDKVVINISSNAAGIVDMIIEENGRRRRVMEPTI
jgi:hypothetical protein